MERIKKNVAGIVDHFTETVEDEVEMLDTRGVVLSFKRDAEPSTVEWICHLIQKPVSCGGAGVVLTRYDTVEKGDDKEDAPSQTFIVTASLKELFKAAEKYSLLKKTHEGQMKVFLCENKYDFENYEEDNENFLSCSERQYLIKHLLEHVVCEDESIKHVVGYEKIKVYKGRPIIPRCVACHLINIYPLHNNDELKSLKKKWYKSLTEWRQPIESIKSYFGENVALYFYFLDFYTKYLIPPAVIGVFHYLFFPNNSNNVWFAVLNLVWATTFLELWKRKSCYLVFDWGRLKTLQGTSKYLEKPRAEYRGQPRVSPITGLLEPHYPTWRRRLKMYLGSYPLLLLSLAFAVIAMIIYLEVRQSVSERFEGSSGRFLAPLATRLPSVLYALAIYVVNGMYGNIAVKLNDWENHRVQTSYDNHLIIKLTLFYFINSFLSSFYIAFYLRDMLLLQQHLSTLLITQQVFQQVKESLTPYLMYKKRSVKVEKEGKKLKVKGLRDPKNQVVREGKLPAYDGTFQDYLEMVVQFGYVFMFSAVYPLAGFWALLNNITELRTDAFKLCRLHQRPFSVNASSIGAWQGVFEFMAILAVITNCSLIGLSPPIRKWLHADTHPVTYVLIFVIMEHGLILMKMAIQRAIPDIPGPLMKELAKREFKRDQEMLRLEREKRDEDEERQLRRRRK